MGNQIIIKRRPKLTGGQQVLLDLITKKIVDEEPISFDEAKEIYFSKVAKNLDDNGNLLYFDVWKERIVKSDGMIDWKGGYVVMLDYYVKQRVLMWLVNSIGSMVLKGYLKIIPQIEI